MENENTAALGPENSAAGEVRPFKWQENGTGRDGGRAILAIDWEGGLHAGEI